MMLLKPFQWLFAGLIAAPLALMPQLAHAEPLNLEDVPDDATYVVHIDVDEFKDTGLADRLSKKQPDMFQAICRWMEEKYGLDPREDLHGVTFYSDTYEPHTGSLIIDADYNVEKVKESLARKHTVKVSTWQDITLLTCTSTTDAKSHFRAPKDSAKDSQKETKRDKEQGSKTAKQNQDENTRDRPFAVRDKVLASSVTIALMDGKAVVASSPQRLKDTVSLLQGNGQAIKPSSPLLEQLTEGSIFYGAAMNLNKLERPDDGFPILSQHKRIMYTAGQHDDEFYEHVVLEANSKEVAAQMQDVLEGFVAVGELYTNDNKKLAKLFDNVKIDARGNTVAAMWQADTEVVLEGLSELKRYAGFQGKDQTKSDSKEKSGSKDKPTPKERKAEAEK